MKNKKHLIKNAKHLLHDVWSRNEFNITFSEFKRRCNVDIDGDIARFTIDNNSVIIKLDSQEQITSVKTYIKARNATLYRNN